MFALYQLGCFLIGWFGIVFKTDIRQISDHLVVGLTTGYLGSLTTFSGWNQKMLDLSANGHWLFAFAGVILGKLSLFFRVIYFDKLHHSVKLSSWPSYLVADKSIRYKGQFHWCPPKVLNFHICSFNFWNFINNSSNVKYISWMPLLINIYEHPSI